MAGAELIAQGIVRRRAILSFIRSYVKDFGVSPSMVEIAEHVGVTKTAVRNHLDIMVGDGTLANAPGRHRSIRVLSNVTPPRQHSRV